jgi:hypothetical protein
MNRRDFVKRFLATAAGAAVAHTLDLDKMLWVAGERTFFIPPSTPQHLEVSLDRLYALVAPWRPTCQNDHVMIHEAAVALADEIDRRALQHYYDFYRNEAGSVARLPLAAPCFYRVENVAFIRPQWACRVEG